ncbi:nitrogen fixation protein NifQ [Acidocella sp.]|uniref:nitrogen fixation protein NifQ n=1 Tax=Acidocella sp. TaxID=50710 RepID=UPI0026133EF9|nr:nitrogen fixation protein NifQ [Acidocella sp.]
MDAALVYGWLMSEPAGGVGADDRHAVACVLALGLAEAGGNLCDVCAKVGLTGVQLRALIKMMFAGQGKIFEGLDAGIGLDVPEQEQALRDLLRLYACDASELTFYIGAMIARRAQMPNHLWQDLGLACRAEGSALIGRHFPRLKARNSQDMKWKKFFYRLICRSEGGALCAAPVCSACDEFDNCFGTEDGEARMARISSGFILSAR